MKVRLIIFFLTWVWTYGPASAMNLPAEFNQAQSFFDKGQYKKSVDVLKRIIRKFPDYRAAYFLLGRIFSRTGDHKKAAKYFNEAGNSFVNPATAFEFGIAMFSVNRNDAAIRAFKEVRADNANFGYARFYGGVGHIKARRWEQADRWLRSAKGLPPEFESLRRQYLANIQKRKRQERQGLISAPILTYEQPPPVMFVPDQQPTAPVDKELEKKPSPPPPVTGFNFFLTPKLEYYNKSIRANRHGSGETTTVTAGPMASLVAKPTFSFFLGNRSDPPSELMLFLEYQVKDHKLNKKAVDYLLVEGGSEEDFVTTEQVTETRGVAVNYYLLRAEPQLHVFLGKHVDLRLGGYIIEKYPDKRADHKIRDNGPKGGISLNLDQFSLSLSGQQAFLTQEAPDSEDGLPLQTTVTFFSGLADLSLENLFNISGSLNYVKNNSDDVNIYVEQLENFGSVMVGEVTISKDFGDFAIFAIGTATEKNPLGEFVTEGTAKENKGVLKFAYDFPFGFSTAFSAEFAQVAEYNKLGLKKNSEIDNANAEKTSQAATAKRSGYIIDLKLTPLDWAYFSGSYAKKSSQYDVIDKEYQNDFISQVPDVVETFIYTFGLTKTF